MYKIVVKKQQKLVFIAHHKQIPSIKVIMI